MSQFLAPVHTWLFNKILVLENIEKELITDGCNDSLMAQHDQLLSDFGPYLPDAPLDTIIDLSNIHGWLQQQINLAETRQAATISLLMKEDQHAVKGIEKTYHQVGLATAKQFERMASTPKETFQLLNDVLLEGMPCDRVNKITEEDETRIIWTTQQCVHKQNWESNGVDVNHYYQFRAAFTAGFVSAISENQSYSYTNDGQQIHQITRG